MGLTSRIASLAKRFRRGARELTRSHRGQTRESEIRQFLGEESVMVVPKSTPPETPTCLVQHARGHYVSALDSGDVVVRNLQDGDDSFSFNRTLTYGFDSRYYAPNDKVILFSFWIPSGEDQVDGDADRKYLVYDAPNNAVNVKECEPIDENMTSLSTDDRRFFIHEFHARAYDVFEVLQCPGLYLACRGSDLFLKHVSPDQLSKDSEIHFQIKYVP